MYYLNDKHPQYEYVVYIRHGTGTPFFSRNFNSYRDLCRFMDEKIKYHNHYHQIYYIDNANYENEYEKNYEGTYYKILKRPVSDWEEVA